MRRRMTGNKSNEEEFRRREAELQSLAHIQVPLKLMCLCASTTANTTELKSTCTTLTCQGASVFQLYIMLTAATASNAMSDTHLLQCL